MKETNQYRSCTKSRTLASLFFSLLMIHCCLMASNFDFESAPPLNCEKAAFRFWKPEECRFIRALLVLVPGSNEDGRPMTEELIWRDFARGHDLALVGCQFTDRPH